MLARNLREGSKWVTGTVVARTGPVSYRVQVGDQVWRRHTDQLLASGISPVDDTDSQSGGSGSKSSPVAGTNRDLPLMIPVLPQSGANPCSTEKSAPRVMGAIVPTMPSEATKEIEPPTLQKKYPTRHRRPPDTLSHETHAK